MKNLELTLPADDPLIPFLEYSVRSGAPISYGPNRYVCIGFEYRHRDHLMVLARLAPVVMVQNKDS